MFSAKIREGIERSVLCWLASADVDGQPNVSPKEIFCLYGETQFLVADIASPISRRNISLNPRVCVSCIDVFAQKGYKIVGDADVVVPADPRWAELSAPLVALAGPEFPIRAVIHVDVLRVLPIVAPSYRLFPDRTEADQIKRAYETYGVRAVD